MGFGYSPREVSGANLDNNVVSFGQVWQCPAFPTPSGSKVSGTTLPTNGKDSKTQNSYGLRVLHAHRHYPGEKVASDLPYDVNREFVKLPSLYQPSQLPYMVDSCTDINNAAGPPLGRCQWSAWYMTSGVYGPGWSTSGALHLRHSRRGNAWMPDGHVGSWAAADTKEFRFPGAGAVGSDPLGYSY